jgi:methyl-accepting chemotaxis protein
MLITSLAMLAAGMVVSLTVFFAQSRRLDAMSDRLSEALEKNADNTARRELTNSAVDASVLISQVEKEIDSKMQNSALTLQKIDQIAPESVNVPLLQKVAAETGVSDMYLTDRDGNFTMSTVPESAGGNLFDIWDGYRACVDEGAYLPSAVKVMAETGKIYKFTAIPRYDQAGNITGIIESALDASAIEEYIAEYAQTDNIDAIFLIESFDGLTLTANVKDSATVRYVKGSPSGDPLAMEAAESGRPRLENRDDGTLLYYLPLRKDGYVAYVLLVESKTGYFYDSVEKARESSDIIMASFTRGLVVQTVIGFLLAAAIIAVYVRLIRKSVLDPIREAGEAAELMAAGDTQIGLTTNRRDEIGHLNRAFVRLAESVRRQGEVVESVAAGDFSAKLEERGPKDVFSRSLNKMTSSLKEYISTISETMGSFAQGRLDASISVPFLGDFNPIKESINYTMRTQKEYIREVADALEKISGGDFSASIHRDFAGDFNALKLYINKMIESQRFYIANIAQALEKLRQGDISVKIDKDFDGEFAPIKTAVNETAAFLSACITEIERVLKRVAASDLTEEIRTRFIGDFGAIQEAITSIVRHLNSSVAQINGMANMVGDGSDVIARGTLVFAEGSREQTEIVRNLALIADKILETGTLSVENAGRALEISSEAMKEVGLGSECMKKLMEAMGEIDKSSKEISNIIVRISEIAFQTNLLALNAAVEAARAGEAGKGFSVVAEEVRELAIKANESAKSVETLVTNSVNAVKKGEVVAKETAESLAAIIGSTKDITEIIKQIHKGSNEQLSISTQITNDLERMTSVVATNMGQGESAASASQELAAQAASLKNLTGTFRIK